MSAIIENYEYEKNIIINGVEKDFSHLQPVKLRWDFEVNHNNSQEFEIKIIFSPHIFTEGGGEHNYDIHDKTGNFGKKPENIYRIFDKERYVFSQKLIDFFKEKFNAEFNAHKQVQRNDYFLILNKDEYNSFYKRFIKRMRKKHHSNYIKNQKYHIFFRILNNNTMLVTSAFFRPDNLEIDKTQKIGKIMEEKIKRRYEREWEKNKK